MGTRDHLTRPLEVSERIHFSTKRLYFLSVLKTNKTTGTHRATIRLHRLKMTSNMPILLILFTSDYIVRTILKNSDPFHGIREGSIVRPCMNTKIASNGLQFTLLDRLARSLAHIRRPLSRVEIIPW